MFRSARKRVSDWITSQRFEMARRHLESEIEKAVSLVQGHKEAGLPSGHAHYGKLLSRVVEAIAAFQEQARQLNLPVPDTSDVEASIPALRDIQEMASGSPSGLINSETIKAVAIGFAFLTFGGTVVYTVCQVLHHYMIRLLLR